MTAGFTIILLFIVFCSPVFNNLFLFTFWTIYSITKFETQGGIFTHFSSFKAILE